MFGLFPHLPLWATLIILALAAYAVLKRRKIFIFWGNLMVPHQVKAHWNALAAKADVEKVTTTFRQELPELLSDQLVDRILAKMPEAMEQRAANTIANLTAKVNALRKQVKGEDGWVSVGVHVRGFKVNEDDKEEYFAMVEYNFQAGGLRAAQNASRRVLVPKSRLDAYYDNPFYGCQRKATHLGSPWYGKVNGDPSSIVMLGEAYTLLK